MFKLYRCHRRKVVPHAVGSWLRPQGPRCAKKVSVFRFPAVHRQPSVQLNHVTFGQFTDVGYQLGQRPAFGFGERVTWMDMTLSGVPRSGTS